MGYSGGSKPNPTYRSLGDHTETVEIDYDPSRISFAELLEIFWTSHDPAARSWSRQYKAAVFCHDEEQKRLATESKNRREAASGRPIHTEILAYRNFTPAEDYHQKYRLQQDEKLAAEFEAMYPSARDLMNSTAAARVNGFLGGYGTAEQLKREISSYGLSPASQKRLVDLLSASRPVFRSCPL